MNYITDWIVLLSLSMTKIVLVSPYKHLNHIHTKQAFEAPVERRLETTCHPEPAPGCHKVAGVVLDTDRDTLSDTNHG